MKKLWLVVALLMLSASTVKAEVSDDLGDHFVGFYHQVVDQLHFTALESVGPAYWYDLRTGTSEGAVIDNVFTYGFLTLDAGWKNALSGDKTGAAILGGSAHIDKIVRLFAPEFSDAVTAWMTPSIATYWKKFDIGFGAAHNFQEDQFTYGLYGHLRF